MIGIFTAVIKAHILSQFRHRSFLHETLVMVGKVQVLIMKQVRAEFRLATSVPGPGIVHAVSTATLSQLTGNLERSTFLHTFLL